MKYDFITIGGATQDISFYTQEGVLLNNKKDLLRQKLLAFEYGAKIRIDKTYRSFGGGATNTAVNFVGLGFKVASFVCLGKDERGRKVINNLRKKKVSTKLIQENDIEETSFSFIIVGPDNEHIIFSDRGTNQHLKITAKDIVKLKQARYLYITSLAGDWQNNLGNIFAVPDVKIVWNPGHTQIISGYKKLAKFLKKTHILCVNKDEAIGLIISNEKYKRKEKTFLNRTKNLLTILYEFGPNIVVVTNGQHGADVYDGSCFYHQDVLPEQRRVDTTGVGDAFNSSFIAGLEIYKGDIQEAMYLGVRNASSVIAEHGAQNGLLTKKEI